MCEPINNIFYGEIFSMQIDGIVYLESCPINYDYGSSVKEMWMHGLSLHICSLDSLLKPRKEFEGENNQS